MKYGDPYRVVQFSEQSMAVVKTAIASTDLKWNEGELEQSKNPARKSQVAWIKNPGLYSMLLRMAQQMNVASGWHLNITGLEPVQFGAYTTSDHYNWHVDQHKTPNKGIVRKISMSLALNDDYRGGEFDLEIYKPGTNPRYETFKGRKGSAIFFPSGKWHRVRPVTSDDVRKSIVAWFYGPPYT